MIQLNMSEVYMKELTKPKPFVKWAGGKRQIIEELKKYIPEEYGCYYEPFLGGGALLFELMPKNAVVNDCNKELMNVYEMLFDYKNFVLMGNLLNKHERKHSEKYFYEIRDLDRDVEKFSKLKNYEKAARTIYLNKSCFNGLYRVNKKGLFNVPFGKKNVVNTYDGENLLNIHTYFNNNDVKLLCTDFALAVSDAKEGDFVYFDPPYDTYNNSFTSYTQEGFGKEEQKKLSELYRELDKKGVKLMLSNHNTEYIRELYDGYNIHVINAKRAINSKGNKRGLVEEVIITNY